jgi:subtilisin-like proprotein convertase family protein
MATPPDGQNPQMIMGFIQLTQNDPVRDTDLTSDVVIHEHGHGVSNRLTGNANGLFALQSGGLGEGWSDWWPLMFAQRPTDLQMSQYPSGNYALGLPPNGPGIRNFRYSFNKTLNPLTYGNFDDPVFPSGPGAIQFITGNPGFEVHNAGEIWCSALWDLNWLLINKHGFDSNLYTGYSASAPAGSPLAAGNKLALQLVMDGLKIQPINPTFLDARDAILAADVILTGGQNQFEIWSAFARRGMGLSADDGGNANSINITEAFDIPFTVIQGTKFNDVNGNGLRAGINEVGLSGWTIYNDQNQNGVRDQSTQTFVASGLPQNIRDTTTLNSTVSVSGMTGFVLDINVTLNITHPYDADMDVFLISPSGRKVELFTDVGANLANFTDTTLDDSASTSITLGRAPFSGSFRPEGKLSDFNGDSPNGVWTLQVIDDAPRDVGVLNSWSLQLTAGENNVKTDLNGNYSLIVPGGGTYTVAEEQQLGWTQTAPAAPGVYNVTLATLTVVTGQDFGNQTSSNPNPVLVLPTVASVYFENGPALKIDPKALVTDANSANFDGGVLVVSILVNGTADDRLEIANQGTGTGAIGISGSNVTFGGTVIGSFSGGVGVNPLVITFNANATAPRITALLRQITFRVASDSPSEQARTVSVQITDGSGGPASVAATTVNVVAENDRPVNTVPTGSVTVLRNVALSFTGANAVSIADVDAANSPVLVTLAATNGTMSLNSTTGLTFVLGDGIADTTMSFTGTLPDVNAALSGLSYTSNAGYIGPATVTITSNDQGATGAGGPQSDTDTINLAVGNQPPTLTSVGILNGAVEDTDFVISHSALSLVADDTDPNFDPISFRIETVSSGTLTKNGVAVTPQFTTLGPGESLVWRAAANANGNLPAFSIRATDGMFFTDPPVQVTVGVSPVADSPTLTIVTPLGKAAATYPFSISYDQLAAAGNELDADNDTLVFRVEAVNSGSLNKNGTAVAAGTTTIAAGESLVWTPPAGTSGTVNAFTVTAVDPSGLASSPAVNVPIVTVISTPPQFTAVTVLSPAQRNGLISIPYNLFLNATNAFDPEGNPLTFRVESVQSGSVTKNGVAAIPGMTTFGTGETLVYVPIVGTVGIVDAFTVTASDDVFRTNPPVNVQVNVVNSAPSLSLIGTLSGASEDTPFTITHSAVATLANSFDVDGDTVNFVITGVLNGTLTQNGAPVVPGVTVLDSARAVLWTPSQNANGVIDAFTVRAFDGNLLSSNTTTVRVSVAPINDAPTLSNVVNIINGIETLPFDFTHQILSDAADEADVDNATISFRVESMISGTLLKNGVPVVVGQTSIEPGEKFVWIPPQGARGTVAAFTVTAFDGSLASSTPVTVSLDISPLGLTRMYRSYNRIADYHFFTLSTLEFSSAVQHGYQDETTSRPGFAVPLLSLYGTASIHRMRNPYSGRHYYTANTTERDFLRRIGWVYEKDEGNIFNQPVSGSVEVFRLYNNLTGSHLFTENVAMKNSVLATFPGIWVQHSSLGYAFPLPPSGTSSSANPTSAGARSGAAANNTSAGIPALGAGATSADLKTQGLNPPTISAGLLDTNQWAVPLSSDAADPRGAVEWSQAALQRRPAREVNPIDGTSELLDQVWSTLGQDLDVGVNQLIDTHD